MLGENAIPQNSQRECHWMQHPQSALGRNVLMTLTQGHNFDLGFLTQGPI